MVSPAFGRESEIAVKPGSKPYRRDLSSDSTVDRAHRESTRCRRSRLPFRRRKQSFGQRPSISFDWRDIWAAVPISPLFSNSEISLIRKTAYQERRLAEAFGIANVTVECERTHRHQIDETDHFRSAMAALAETHSDHTARNWWNEISYSGTLGRIRATSAGESRG